MHSFIVKSTQQTCTHDYKRAGENEHLHTNKNNKNAKANVKTHNTLARPMLKTRTAVNEEYTIDDVVCG